MGKKAELSLTDREPYIWFVNIPGEDSGWALRFEKFNYLDEPLHARSEEGALLEASRLLGCPLAALHVEN